MASITTALIPDELQRMILERSQERIALVGKMQDPRTVQVLAAVESKRLGEYVLFVTPIVHITTEQHLGMQLL